MNPPQTSGNGQPMQDTNTGNSNDPQTIDVDFGKCDQQPQRHGHGHGALNIKISQRDIIGRNRQSVDLHSTDTNCQGGTTHRRVSIRSEYEQFPAHPGIRYIPQAHTGMIPQANSAMLPQALPETMPQVQPGIIPRAQPCDQPRGPGATSALNILAEVSVRELQFLENYVNSEIAKRKQ